MDGIVPSVTSYLAKGNVQHSGKDLRQLYHYNYFTKLHKFLVNMIRCRDQISSVINLVSDSNDRRYPMLLRDENAEIQD